MSYCMKGGYSLAAAMLFWIVGLGGAAQATDGKASIEGVLYVSYFGDPSVDVMYGKGVEVLLLGGQGKAGKEMEDLKANRVPQILAQEAAALKAFSELRRLPPQDRAKKEKEKREALEREKKKLEQLRSDYEKEVIALVKKYMIQKTKTDEEGKFRFDGVSPGRHHLHARYEIPGVLTRFFWLHPLELKGGEKLEIELNKAATLSLY